MTDSASITNTESPLFEVEIKRERRKLAPRSIEELDAWILRERQFWSWVSEARSDDPSIDYIVNLVLHQEKQIGRTLTALKSADAAEQRKAHTETLRNLLTERYLKQGAPTSADPAAQFTADLAKKDKVIAAHALWALLGNDPQASNRPARALRGQVLATIYAHEVASAADSHAAAWSQLNSQVSAEHEALRVEAGKLSDDFRRISDEIHILHESQRKTFDELQATRASDFKKLVDEHVSKMQNIEVSFKRELSLRSAVEYLREKANQHRKTARTAGIAAGVVGLVVILLAVYVGVGVFRDTTQIPVPQIAVAVLTATIAFWLLRILVRVLLSNLHLETDMRARSTFVHTYLALLAEGGGIKDEDRALVIGLVFRPISDGLVRDDATPPGLWDLLTKNLSNR